MEKCMRTFLLLLLFVSAASVHATEPKIHRDLPYADTKNKLQTLDIYAPPEGTNHPVAIWIHGGGWHSGDKAEIDNKPRAFTEKGYIFVSINYRLWTPPWTNSDHEGVRRFQWSPTFPGKVTLTDEAEDIARAVRWVRDHIQDYGGNCEALAVLGHSAGASLSALVCTDDRYLKGEGVPLGVIKACIPVDGDAYDIPLHMKTAPARQAEIDRHRFGDDQLQSRLSPVTHVARGKNIPRFLILHVADHPLTTSQSERLAAALREAGVPAKACAAAGTDHTRINSELGLPDDETTQEVFEFLSRAVNGAAD
jgi:acetyl esterase/lipase